MKILLLAPQPFFQNRGTPIAVRLLAEILGREGHNVILLTYFEGEDLTIPNVSIRRIPSLFGITGITPGFSVKKILCDAAMFFAGLKLLQKEDFDLIHAGEESVFMALLYKIFFDIPYVYDMDSCLSDQVAEKHVFMEKFRPLMTCFERAAVGQCLGVVAVCKYLQKTVREWAPGKLVCLLEDISLLSEEDNVGRVMKIRKSLQIDGAIIMYVGNLERYQGVTLLIESFKIVLQANSQSNLVIVGGSPNHIDDHRALSKRLGVEDRIFFLGSKPIEQLGALLRQADILVSPRIKGKNTPMKIYSYLDSGKPLVATRLLTHTQVLDDAISVLTPADPAGMARGIISLLESKERASRLAVRAKERVQQEYSYDAFRRKLLTFYREVVQMLSLQDKEGAT